MASIPLPEIIDPVFAKTCQNARFLLSENERFGLVFVKTGSINSGTGLHKGLKIPALVCNVNTVQCRETSSQSTLKIMLRNVNEILRSLIWIQITSKNYLTKKDFL